jgi:iron complex transport system permease protein
MLAAPIIIMVLAIICIFVGTASLSMHDLKNIINGSLSDGYIYQIICNVRIPRIIIGLIVGANLSVAGTLLQGVLRNPMASQNIIGVNNGAALMAVTLMTVLPSHILLLPVASFIGALAASGLIFLLSMRQNSKSSTVQIVLAGVAVSALLSSLTSGLMILNNDVLDVTYAWMLGSLSGRSWDAVQMLLPYSIIGLGAAAFLAPRVNIFALGDEVARSTGLNITFYRVVIIVIASILAGSAVSAAGVIGFIGLVAPHSARLIIGNDHRFLIPFSAIMGAIILLLSDTIARTVFQPVELSVGIVTGIIGAPFFLFLLRREGMKQ